MAPGASVWTGPTSSASYTLTPFTSSARNWALMGVRWSGAIAASQYLSVMPSQPPVELNPVSPCFFQALKVIIRSSPAGEGQPRAVVVG